MRLKFITDHFKMAAYNDTHTSRKVSCQWTFCVGQEHQSPARIYVRPTS